MLTTVVLFLTVTLVRWLRDPAAPLYIASLPAALVVIGVLVGTLLAGLMVSPPGRRSGGHLNPAVTVALWVMRVFPGRGVVPYVLAQLAGSLAGTGLGRLAWGRAVTIPQIACAAITPAPGWRPASVFLTEAGCLLVLMLVVGVLASSTVGARFLPGAIGLSVGLVIALLGPRSGGSINPARQLGPAVLCGHLGDLWTYLAAPVVGAALGAALHRLLAATVWRESAGMRH